MCPFTTVITARAPRVAWRCCSNDEDGSQLDLTGVTFHKRNQNWQARVKRKKVHHHIGY